MIKAILWGAIEVVLWGVIAVALANVGYMLWMLWPDMVQEHRRRIGRPSDRRG